LGGENEVPQLEAMKKEIVETIPQKDGEKKERFIAVTGDVSQPDTGRKFVTETVDKFGRLDVFVSNAGVCQFAEFLEYAISQAIISEGLNLVLNHDIKTELTHPSSLKPSP
jgi:L-rhamnose 1-dehydrogenase